MQKNEIVYRYAGQWSQEQIDDMQKRGGSEISDVLNNPHTLVVDADIFINDEIPEAHDAYLNVVSDFVTELSEMGRNKVVLTPHYV